MRITKVKHAFTSSITLNFELFDFINKNINITLGGKTIIPLSPLFYLPICIYAVSQIINKKIFGSELVTIIYKGRKVGFSKNAFDYLKLVDYNILQKISNNTYRYFDTAFDMYVITNSNNVIDSINKLQHSNLWDYYDDILIRFDCNDDNIEFIVCDPNY